MKKAVDLIFSHATVNGPFGYYTEGPLIQVMIVTITVATAGLASLLWLFRDAKNRDKNPWVAMLFILATGYPFSFVWWFWLRPPLNEAAAAASIKLPPVPSDARVLI